MKTLVKRGLALLITLAFAIWIANSGSHWQVSVTALTDLPLLALALATAQRLSCAVNRDR